MIVVHCTATEEGRDVGAAEIDIWHRRREFRMPDNIPGHLRSIGYHYVVRLDGTIETGRPEEAVGAHCRGYNSRSIGIVYAGGLDHGGKPKDTRTNLQKKALRRLIASLLEKYPDATVHGHREFAPKACPCFDARSEYADLAHFYARVPHNAGNNKIARTINSLGVFALIVACALFMSACRSHKECINHSETIKTGKTTDSFNHNFYRQAFRQITADSIIIDGFDPVDAIDIISDIDPTDRDNSPVPGAKPCSVHSGSVFSAPPIPRDAFSIRRRPANRVKIYRPRAQNYICQQGKIESASADTISECIKTDERLNSKPASNGLTGWLLTAILLIFTPFIIKIIIRHVRKFATRTQEHK